MTVRLLDLLSRSRAKNPCKGEVVVETIGKGADSLLYRRNGDIHKVEVRRPKLLGWLPKARNPKLLLFRGEAIIVRLGQDKSFLISENGVTELNSEEHWRNDNR